MNTAAFSYHLPSERIAQRSVTPRDQSRLMVVNKKEHTIEHKIFTDIVDYVESGDVLVCNNSKVFKARLYGQLQSEQGDVLLHHTEPVEIFLVRPMENMGVWKVLARPGKHVRLGTRVVFYRGDSGQLAEDFYCTVLTKDRGGSLLVQFPYNQATVRKKANAYGTIPIPPYVKDELHELELYQTMYASQEGSVAAPTAGFHFTPQVWEALKQKGVQGVEVTLHVGLGTFLPVKSERIEDHTMHAEWVEVSEDAATKITAAKQEGRRVICVGTTSVRTLEGVAQLGHPPGVTTSDAPRVRAYQGDIDIFITPGFSFQIVDAMITNFHLPKSTLLMLVSAFAQDTAFMLSCYTTAVEEEYRFYSFGDAMLIH